MNELAGLVPTQQEKTRNDFDRCWPWFDAALDGGGRTHDKEHVWEELVTGRAFFFPGRDGAAIVRITQYPTGLKSLDVWLANGRLSSIRQHLYPIIERWAKTQGCHRMIAHDGGLKAADG